MEITEVTHRPYYLANHPDILPWLKDHTTTCTDNEQAERMRKADMGSIRMNNPRTAVSDELKLMLSATGFELQESEQTGTWRQERKARKQDT